MIVDDTPANLKILAAILEGQGYEVQQFPRAAMALKAVELDPPDLFMLDIMMPEMNGFELCRRLKAIPGIADIPVLFLSALSEVGDKVKAFAAGGVDYITKPFEEREVLARVQAHLSIRRMRVELLKYNQSLESMAVERMRDIYDSQMATLAALSTLAEWRDEDTGSHIERTRRYCRVLAEALAERPDHREEISVAYINSIYHAAPLHDIGKVGIPDNILLKPGKLTQEEFDCMKTHTIIGAQALETVQKAFPKNAFIDIGIKLARTHHEKWDGSGYPDGLRGADIPLAGRIMAVADVYDALRAKRPYKEPLPHAEAYALVLEGSGKQFDPALVECFIRDEGKFDAIFCNGGISCA
jgi:putative two-component system response regulator